MTNDKEIIKKLYKIAQNQQKIIRTLAQATPAREGFYILRDTVEDELQRVFNIQSTIFINITAKSEEDTVTNFDIKIDNIKPDTGNCTTVRSAIDTVLKRDYPQLQMGAVTFNGVAC